MEVIGLTNSILDTVEPPEELELLLEEPELLLDELELLLDEPPPELELLLEVLEPELELDELDPELELLLDELDPELDPELLLDKLAGDDATAAGAELGVTTLSALPPHAERASANTLAAAARRGTDRRKGGIIGVPYSLPISGLRRGATLILD
jgi:hypothetical protein